MVIVGPLNGVVGPLPNGQTSWLINRGDPNHLQVMGAHPSTKEALHLSLQRFLHGAHGLWLGHLSVSRFGEFTARFFFRAVFGW